MIRHAAAVAFAVCLIPSWLDAQTLDFTVKVQSATIHKSPSTGSPVIGRAPRGTVLEVTRDTGAWVKVSWPDAEDGAGFVHQSMGSMTRRATREETLAAAFQPAPATPAMAPAASSGLAAAVVPEATGATRTTYVSTPTHTFGVGGLMGSAPFGSFGVTGRVWSRKRLGVQFAASRSSMTSAVAPGRVTSVEFAPSAVYSLPDHVSDNVWLRPYVGSGVAFQRSTLKMGTPDEIDSPSERTLGYRAFGGAELTFPAVPRFAVSADVGYLWTDAPFADFDRGGFGFSLSGHWYVK